MAAATATQKAFWLRLILEEMGLNLLTPILLKDDKRPALASQITLVTTGTPSTSIIVITS